MNIKHTEENNSCSTKMLLHLMFLQIVHILLDMIGKICQNSKLYQNGLKNCEFCLQTSPSKCFHHMSPLSLIC